MVPLRSLKPSEATEAELESVYRLAAVRDMLNAILEGHWANDPRMINGLRRALEKAAWWARLAQELRASEPHR